MAVTKLINAAAVDGVLGGFKNKVTNGGFDVWQRGTSFSNFNAYTTDRWMSGGTGGIGGTRPNVSAVRSAFAVGQTAVPNNHKYFYSFNFNSGTINYTSTGYECLEQRIEDVNNLSGKTITLSFWARSNISDKKIAITFSQNFGVGGSPIVYFNGAEISLTSSWSKYTITVNVPSIVGKTVGGNSYLRLLFWFVAESAYPSVYLMPNIISVSTYGSIDIAQVQIEEGSYATDFESRHIQQELALCQRYYWRNENTRQYASFFSGAYVGNTSSTTFQCHGFHPVPMRAIPSLSYGGAGFVIDVGTPDGVSSLHAMRTAGVHRFEIAAVSNTARANTVGFLSNSADAYSWIAWDAEL